MRNYQRIFHRNLKGKAFWMGKMRKDPFCRESDVETDA